MNALDINFSHSPPTTSQPDYLHILIYVQSTCKTRSSFAVILDRPSVSSSLQITNRSFRCASPYMESTPFFIPSTSFCSLFSWLTSSCAYHLITVTNIALTIYLSLPRSFTPDLKLISFTTPFLDSLSGSLWTAFTDLNLHRTKWALAVVCFSFFLYFLFMAACAILNRPPLACEFTLDSSFISYRNYAASVFSSRQPSSSRLSLLLSSDGYPDVLVRSIVHWVRTPWLVLRRSRGVTRQEAERSRPITRQLQLDVTSEATSGYYSEY